MAELIDLTISVDGQKTKVGNVTVSRDDVEAAINLWDSVEFDLERSRWCKHKGQGKVFWKGIRCYPPKKIMRLASREGVKVLSTKVSDPRILVQLQDGLNILEGGYQVLETYHAAGEIGYRVDRDVSVITKTRHGS